MRTVIRNYGAAAFIYASICVISYFFGPVTGITLLALYTAQLFVSVQKMERPAQLVRALNGRDIPTEIEQGVVHEPIHQSPAQPSQNVDQADRTIFTAFDRFGEVFNRNVQYGPWRVEQTEGGKVPHGYGRNFHLFYNQAQVGSLLIGSGMGFDFDWKLGRANHPAVARCEIRADHLSLVPYGDAFDLLFSTRVLFGAATAGQVAAARAETTASLAAYLWEVTRLPAGRHIFTTRFDGTFERYSEMADGVTEPSA